MACNPLLSAALSAALLHWHLPPFPDAFWKTSAAPAVTHITDQQTGQTYASISDVIHAIDYTCPPRGHTFLIPAGTYAEAFPAIQSFVACRATDILVRLQGVGGYAKLINTNGGGATNNKGVLDVYHCPVILDHLELSGAGYAGGNVAGIRMDHECYELIVMNSWIHDNNDGILTDCCQAQPSLLVAYNNRWEHNGDLQGDYGHVHNVYIGDMGGGGGTLIFVNNLSCCAYVGHLLKSRAPHNFIIGNRLLTGLNATARISSGSYNNSTGAVSLTISQDLQVQPLDQVTLSNMTGSGSYAQLNGTWGAAAGTRGTKLNLIGPPAGLTLTITGGTASNKWGTASYVIDLPNGTFADIENNVLYKGPNAGTAVFIHHGGEVPNPVGEADLIVANNTVVAGYPGSQLIWEQGVVAAGTPVRSVVSNNTFYGLDPSGIVLTGRSPEVSQVPYGSPNNTFLPLNQAPTPDYSAPAACSP